MSIEERLDILIEKMDRLIAISGYIEGQMVDKVDITELENVVKRLSKHNKDFFVSRSEFNELKKLVNKLSLNIEKVKDEIPSNCLVADDLHDYAHASAVAILLFRVEELEAKIDSISP